MQIVITNDLIDGKAYVQSSYISIKQGTTTQCFTVDHTHVNEYAKPIQDLDSILV
jgi:hypothetical protein